MNVSWSSREKYQNLKRKSRKIVFFADDFLFCKSSFPNNLLTSNYAIYIGYMIKGGNLWYKLDCYGSLYRITEYDSTYKICTWYQKGYEREITQDGFIFFIVTREHNDIWLLRLKSLYTLIKWKYGKMVLFVIYIRTTCTCYSYYVSNSTKLVFVSKL